MLLRIDFVGIFNNGRVKDLIGDTAHGNDIAGSVVVCRHVVGGEHDAQELPSPCGGGGKPREYPAGVGAMVHTPFAS